MLWTEKLFGVKKPIIAMLHLDPLPGDPLYKKEKKEWLKLYIPARTAVVLRKKK